MEPSTEGIREFEALVLRHHVRLRVFVRSLGVDADWVDDVSQEACLTAFRQWESFDQSRDFGKWLRGIAANIVRNELRKEARRQRIMHAELAEILVGRQQPLNEQYELRNEQMTIDAVRDCIAELGPTSQKVVEGRYREDLRAPELAELLDMTAANVRQMLVRIRRRLRQCVELRLLKEAAWTVVQFLDGSVITVLGRSELAVTEDDEGRKILRLNDGVMSADVQPQPQGCPMIVRTPTAEMEIVGTQFNVDAKALETRLAVNEGLVRLRRLSDGESVDVEAQHQVVASIDELEQLKASPRGSAVFSWKSDLKSDVRHGSWVSDIELLAKRLKVAVKRGELTDLAASVRYKKAATLSDSGSVWATPYLAQKPQGKLFPKSLVLLSATGRSHPAVITGTSTFRIRGTLYGSPDSKLVFGISTNRKSGGFFGKFMTEVAVTESGEPFDAEIPVSTFKHVDTRHGMSPDQKELAAVWCVVEGGKTKLRFSSVELLPGTAASVGQDQQD